MRYVLFDPALEGVSQEEIQLLLRQHAGPEFIATGLSDAPLEKVEIWINPEHELDVSLIDSLPNLRMISLAFTGHEKVDVPYLRSRGLEVYYVPNYSTDSVAELTIGLTLSVLRKIADCDKNVRAGTWNKGVDPGIELHKKEVAILGTGTIGIASAKLYRAFGCEVVGWAAGHEKQAFRDLGLRYKQDLSEVFAQSDIIALHLPVTAETRHIVGFDLLQLMKPTSVLVNTSRSELVDTNALVRTLTGRPTLRAAIDVVDVEPLVDGRLLKLNNILISPHMGFRTKEALRRLAEEAIRNICRFQGGSSDNLLK